MSTATETRGDTTERIETYQDPNLSTAELPATSIDEKIAEESYRVQAIHTAALRCAAALDELDEEQQAEAMKLLAPYAGSSRGSRGGSRRRSSR